MRKWEHQTIFKYLTDNSLTEVEATFIINRISNAVRQCGDTNCCDNFRFSINDNNEEGYEAMRDSGCCGFYDDIITLNSGKTVKYGFNYGH